MRIILAAFALLTATGTTAAEPEACPPAPTAPPPHFSSWSEPRALPSVTKAEDLEQAHFAAGEAVELQLHPDGEVAYQTLPQGAGEAKSFGGMARFSVTEAGLYSVGLGAFAWVDVVRNGVPQKTSTFGHGPECTGIRKVVSFQLEPGDYTLEISGNEQASIRVLVGRAG
ncbi:homogentisate 1,2-dioxygenase [Croceibacterium sp. LX-88]|uniref:Homogentisate 1,2-dioxygenase n=1 Tax=Croceibacterium selenioxidans TaxID=2838833 RepID=A0ABS5VZP3_9SPHN|nr:homogentisate 1,2-dioxygenase [Croceibacterium selenioxidans]MBT2132995.1 homogentisate 1,2-dioxygenase [Croceibacterium selenioxidans]